MGYRMEHMVVLWNSDRDEYGKYMGVRWIIYGGGNMETIWGEGRYGTDMVVLGKNIWGGDVKKQLG